MSKKNRSNYRVCNNDGTLVKVVNTPEAVAALVRVLLRKPFCEVSLQVHRIEIINKPTDPQQPCHDEAKPS